MNGKGSVIVMKLAVLLFSLFCSSYGKLCGSTQNNDDSSCKLRAYPPNPDEQCCGIDTTATDSIVGGDETGLMQYPWMALIEFVDSDGETDWKCGGFLISGYYVITAAHCIVRSDDNKPTKVILGDYNLKHKGRDCLRDDNEEVECTDGDLSIPIKSVEAHEDYNSTTYDNDIALIRLKKLVPYRDYIRPICLPTTDKADELPYGVRFHSAGWGVMKQIPGRRGFRDSIDKYSNIKRHVDLPYVSRNTCLLHWDDVPVNHICAGGEEGKDVCMGDSGGPLMYENNGVYEAVGIVSFGPWLPCGKKNVPGAYTNVYRYKDWIYNKIKKHYKH